MAGPGPQQRKQMRALKAADKALRQGLARTARANQNIRSAMVEKQHGPVTTSHNLEAVIQQIRAINYPKGVDLTVHSDVLYAPFVEFGTRKMLPAAMIRKSEPEIQAEIEREAKALPPLAGADEIVAMQERIGEFAVKAISKKTPRSNEVKELHLQDSFEAGIVVRR